MRRLLIAAILLSSTTGVATAQTADTLLPRVNKLEKEMRAVQRKVFPNGVALEPEIGAATAPPEAAGSPASSPLADLTARVDTIEAQLKTLTGQLEADSNRIRKLEEALSAQETRLKALEPATVSASAAAVPAAATPAPRAATAEAPAAPKAAPARNDSGRKALIDAVEIPASGDAVEDAYTYGFRLWQAKLYPEAQAKLKEFVAKNPAHRRASYAQNLLGRAYLDEGKPALASVAFYDNYQKMPKGERASESLYWLGVALTRLKKPADACKVFDEFEAVYAEKAPADLKNRVVKGKADAKCAA